MATEQPNWKTDRKINTYRMAIDEQERRKLSLNMIDWVDTNIARALGALQSEINQRHYWVAQARQYGATADQIPTATTATISFTEPDEQRSTTDNGDNEN